MYAYNECGLFGKAKVRHEREIALQQLKKFLCVPKIYSHTVIETWQTYTFSTSLQEREKMKTDEYLKEDRKRESYDKNGNKNCMLENQKQSWRIKDKTHTKIAFQ